MSVHPASLSPHQQAMVELWDTHLRCALERRSIEDTMDTLIEFPITINVPALTGGVGYQQVQHYVSQHFIAKTPPDAQLTRLSRTVGSERVVDELLLSFTHSLTMDWMLPGIPPTGKWVEVAVVAIVSFEDGLIASEHLYWDQASVLVQLGLLAPDGLPVVGADSARALRQPTSPPTNRLMQCSHAG